MGGEKPLNVASKVPKQRLVIGKAGGYFAPMTWLPKKKLICEYDEHSALLSWLYLYIHINAVSDMNDLVQIKIFSYILAKILP